MDYSDRQDTSFENNLVQIEKYGCSLNVQINWQHNKSRIQSEYEEVYNIWTQELIGSRTFVCKCVDVSVYSLCIYIWIQCKTKETLLHCTLRLIHHTYTTQVAYLFLYRKCTFFPVDPPAYTCSPTCCQDLTLLHRSWRLSLDNSYPNQKISLLKNKIDNTASRWFPGEICTIAWCPH